MTDHPSGCGQCGRSATCVVGFPRTAGGTPTSSTLLCRSCFDGMAAQYGRMGKPGQIVILPWPSDGAQQWLKETA